MSDYSKSHVTFDKYEIAVSLHCLKCNMAIARRDELPSKRDANVVLHALVKAPHYREVKVSLSDGSIMYMPFCAGCTKDPIDPDKALDVVKQGWRMALRHAGRPQEAIAQERLARLDLKVETIEGVQDARKLQ